ncbi:MAG: hypothetical protein Q9180_006065, partial [Flavoplaca navasiana]
MAQQSHTAKGNGRLWMENAELITGLFGSSLTLFEVTVTPVGAVLIVIEQEPGQWDLQGEVIKKYAEDIVMRIGPTATTDFMDLPWLMVIRSGLKGQVVW